MLTVFARSSCVALALCICGCGGGPEGVVDEIIAGWTDLADAAEKKDAARADAAIERLLKGIDAMDALPSDQVIAAADKRKAEMNQLKERLRKADAALVFKADQMIADRVMANMKKKLGGK